ncbi:MAG: O-antigen ligase family protein [Hyphomicrobiales bacterium]
MKKTDLKTEDLLFKIVQVAIYTAPVLMVFSRNISTPILCFVALLLCCIAFNRSKFGNKLSPDENLLFKISVLTIITLFAFMAISSLWSANPIRALQSTSGIMAVAVVCTLSLLSLKMLPMRSVLSSELFVIILLITAILILEELAFGSQLRILLGGSGDAFRINRAAVALVLYLPCALSIMSKDNRGLFLGSLNLITIGCAVFLSESESAKLAFLIVVTALPFFVLFARKVFWLFASLIVLSLVILPILSPLLSTVLKVIVSDGASYGSAGIRADIWAAYAKQFINAPFFGHGVEGSYSAGVIYKENNGPDQLLARMHPHNFAVQVWYELGLLGVMLFSALIVMYFRALWFVPDKFLPAILTTTAAVWTISLVSHGAWQAWWWSLVGLLVLLWVIVLRADEALSAQDQITD